MEHQAQQVYFETSQAYRIYKHEAQMTRQNKLRHF